MEKPVTKVKDLKPDLKQVNVLAKVVSVGEAKEIPSKFGSPRRVSEVVVGDETGTVVLSLWQEQIGTVAKDEVIAVDNGYITLVKGKMRLNVGKYGHLTKSNEPVENVNTTLDMSEKEYEMERRPYREFSDRDRGDRGRRRF